MKEKKTLEERYGNEVLTDNTKIKSYEQCKDCIFRDKTTVNNKECGWRKCFCRMFGKRSVSNMKQLSIPYVPVNDEDKPDEVYHGTANCEFYEKEKRKK